MPTELPAFNLTLDAIGLTPEKLQDLVVDRVASALTDSLYHDEDGEEERVNSRFYKSMQEAVANAIDTRVREAADRALTPVLGERIEDFVLQKTNSWGEKVGKPVNLVEYMVQRAEAWINDEVDIHGKTKEQEPYSWRKHGNRLAIMIERHFMYAIETAIKKIVEDANAHIAGGLENAVKIKLEEIQKGLAVTVSTKN